jgi:hypothetical protein
MFQVDDADISRIDSQLEADGFVFRQYPPEAAEAARIHTPYGRAFINERYARERWNTDTLEVVEFIPGGLRGWQDIYVVSARQS